MDTNLLIKQVVQCCYIVHQELGPGFSEKIYERSLSIALSENGIQSVAQYPIHVYFHEHLVGEYAVDVMVANKLIVELKAVRNLDSSHKSQVLNYLKATRNDLGLLVNFGAAKLELNRLFNNSK